MSTGSPKLARREQALEATRRRLRRLEIETHRIKADLARLEANYEDDFADWLSLDLHGQSSVDAPAILGIVAPGSKECVPADAEADFALADASDVENNDISLSGSNRVDAVTTSVHRVETHSECAAKESDKETTPVANLRLDESATAEVPTARRWTKHYRHAASPLLCSFALHGVLLLFCLTFTIATIVRQNVPLLSTPNALDEVSVDEFSDVEIPITRFEDAEIQNVVYKKPEFSLSDDTRAFVEPTELGVGTQPHGEIGQLDALPGELGTLMAGAGKPAAAPPGGPVGEAVFFGARSKGDRFAFVVDNSSSMKDGRLESAIAELLNATNALTPKQSFYVIFVSDETYPMFFPQAEPDMVPATPANKQRLAKWLPNAILASGKNRELMKAMDMAAALRPHAVFLLWDGDMRYSEKVRVEVMTHLTRPNLWNFPVHTLGMGDIPRDAEQNLTMIANAHGGTFRKIAVPMVRGQR